MTAINTDTYNVHFRLVFTKKVEKLGSTSQYLRGIGRYTSVSSGQCGLQRTLAKVTYSETLS